MGLTLAQPAPGPGAPVPPFRPWRLLLGAIGLLLLAAIAQFLVDFLVAFVVGFHNGRAPSVRWAMPPWLTGVISVVALQAALIALALWRAGRSGVGRSHGAGLLPVRRPLLLAGFVVLNEVLVVAWLLALKDHIPVPRSTGTTALFAHGVAARSVPQMVLVFSTLTALPAIAEELFFRGWLWQALSRRWRPLPVSLVTAVLWLLPHAADGWKRPLFLVPMAVMLSLARLCCGSVKASMVLHFVNNALLVGLVLGVGASR